MEISVNNNNECMLPTGLLKKPGLPLYFQLFELLRDRIIDGYIPVGSTLPTEQRIAEQSRAPAERGKDERRKRDEAEARKRKREEQEEEERLSLIHI